MVLPMIDWLSPIISCNLIPSSNPSHTLSATIYIYIQILHITFSNMSKNLSIYSPVVGWMKGLDNMRVLTSFDEERRPLPLSLVLNRIDNRLYLPVSSCSYVLLISLYISPLYRQYQPFLYGLSNILLVE